MKRILIVGASSGIGAALAKILDKQGHEVIGTYNTSQPPLESSNVRFYKFDVLNNNDTPEFIPDTLDGLVYCPGSINLKPFTRLKKEAFLQDYELNVTGFTQVLQQSLPALKKSNSAAVVSFSTVAVQNGFPFHAQVSASKGAIEGLTKALAAEFAPSIRVNAIAPSLTQTPLANKLLSSEEKITSNDNRHPLRRIGQAEDIAQMAAFLLSDNSSWISGQIIPVDGGMSTLKI